jgi:hypothetical protein
LNKLAESDTQRVTLKTHLLVVAGGYLVVAAVELLAHWLLGKQLFRGLLWIYLLHTASGGVSVFPDMILPAFLLGWWNARTSRYSSARRAAAFVLPLSFGTVALLPLYAKLVGEREVIWWWPKTPGETAMFLAIEFFFASVAVLLPIKAFHKTFPI